MSKLADLSKVFEVTKSITKLAYRIEPTPDGRFIAHSKDPNVQPIEGATREEVQQKVQEKLESMVKQQFPDFKWGGLNITINGRTVTHSETPARPDVVNAPASNAPVYQPTTKQLTPGPIAPESASSPLLKVATALAFIGLAVYFYFRFI